jgi:hypothetical protein
MNLKESQTARGGSRPSSGRERVRAWAAIAALFLFAWGVGLRGLDFGKHWDEWYHVHGLKAAIQDLSLLTHEYTYNGVYFDLGYVMVLPHALHHASAVKAEIDVTPKRPLDFADYPSIAALQKDLQARIAAPSYLLEARVLFMTLSLLGVLFTFLLVRVLAPERPGAAVAAGALVALSWEVGYHARFVAVDALMLALSAACFWQLARFALAPDAASARKALMRASLIGGVALGCKATGVFFAVPIAAVAFARAGRPTRPTARLWATTMLDDAMVSALVFSLAFFVTTPGALLEPVRFYGAIAFENLNYREGVNRGYNVAGFWDALTSSLRWLFVAAPSPFSAIGQTASIIAVIGAVAAWRRERRLAIGGGAFVVVYTAFLATGTQLIVRNSLVLVPLLGAAFGIGFSTAWAWGGRPLRGALAVGGAFALVANGAWAVYAAESIRNTTKVSVLKAVADHMIAERGDWLVSPDLRGALGERIDAAYACEAVDVPGEDKVLAFAADTHKYNWQANRTDLIDRVWSSLEVNYHYYPNWRARHWKHRVVEMSAAHAAVVKMNLPRFVRCRPRP